jgi:hypothetical protein
MAKKTNRESDAQSVSAQIDRELAAAALRKRQLGQRPTRQELAALRRLEKARDEDQRWAHYRSISQTHWRQMSGRLPKQLREQAQRTGIAFGGAQIDLTVVLPQLYAFLARNARVLERVDTQEFDRDEAALGPETPSLERMRWWRAELYRMDAEERAKTHLPRDEIHRILAEVASLLRTCLETLESDFGPDAAQLLRDALDDADRLVLRNFGAEGSGLTDDLSIGRGTDRGPAAPSAPAGPESAPVDPDGTDADSDGS